MAKPDCRDKEKSTSSGVGRSYRPNLAGLPAYNILTKDPLVRHATPNGLNFLFPAFDANAPTPDRPQRLQGAVAGAPPL
jgi:hypothetical protein